MKKIQLAFLSTLVLILFTGCQTKKNNAISNYLPSYVPVEVDPTNGKLSNTTKAGLIVNGLDILLGNYHDKTPAANSPQMLENKFNEKGFNYLGIHKNTGTKFDINGFDINGINAKGEIETLSITYEELIAKYSLLAQNIVSNFLTKHKYKIERKKNNAILTRLPNAYIINNNANSKKKRNLNYSSNYKGKVLLEDYKFCRDGNIELNIQNGDISGKYMHKNRLPYKVLGKLYNDSFEGIIYKYTEKQPVGIFRGLFQDEKLIGKFIDFECEGTLKLSKM